MTPQDKRTIDRFENALTNFLVAQVYNEDHPNLRSELWAARGAAQAIIGADAQYRHAVDAANACRVAAWHSTAAAPAVRAFAVPVTANPC
jgi:hypothetical protein